MAGFIRLCAKVRAATVQVITCAASDAQDIVLKKSLFQYITTYATANPELMLLTINMLLKDCGDQDPTIRGLALRSLCSLTISNLTEYLARLRAHRLRLNHSTGSCHTGINGCPFSPRIIDAKWLQ